MIPLRDNIRLGSFFPSLTLGIILLNAYVFYLELTSDSIGIIAAYSLIPAKLMHNINTGTPHDLIAYLPLVSNLFLHGSWFHIIGNMWYLWLFGRTSEACLGHLKYLCFYFACGITSNLTQVLFDPNSNIPLIGASGAVSGVLGSYLTCFPSARILTLIPLFLFFPIIEIPAYLFIGVWFLLQLEQGAIAGFIAGSNIAWWAHIGGFLTGIVLSRVFRNK
ncbi:MAG TPA: rhomboid family intramembrane serine protease [Methylomusa anaerophila]|uniref:Rhomboid family protein n=1 Tax=Methylomusa anaerophila TaxID=1930071 RepID=A0A348AG43_9FIRM|nr:rhomboid family intramembrane serine protease [Methylomusa anaerophila]BBB90041.1 rhomboid family protein [Methylomusa anaerophila]HML88232.1 rhomboid family intramembrane serine protease [Methylomusa anaerophila]